MRAHIVAALAAIEAKDVVSARQAVAAARRALGNWGGGPLRTLDQVAVSVATGTSRDTIAISLANAAEALRGDTWPGDEPPVVAAFLASDEDVEPHVAAEVSAWLCDHDIISAGVARVSLASALAELEGR